MIKNILVLFVIIFIIGCDNENKFGFSSSNCNEVYTNCLNKCIQSGKTRAECLGNCDKSRGMCESIKIKGCMQDCNKVYGKGTASSESCKRSCMNNRGN